jgi:site-specific DNA-adenine methylase
MKNSIFVIEPYKWEGLWVFDAPRAGLVREPFVGGADRIIDVATSHIPKASDGFLAIFQAVNSALVLLYWEVGQRIRRDILREKRAEYGEEILPTLSAKLVADFGNGFSARNLARMIRFAEVFPTREIVATLSR